MNKTLGIPYQHSAVRDLAWVMASPGLLQTTSEESVLVSDEWCRTMYTQYQLQLQALDENPQPLIAALSRCKSYRLGIYFEFLLAYWLRDIFQVKQLRHNVPVFQQQDSGGQKTLGEFDFLFRFDAPHTLQHWEATVKFYLLQNDAEGNPCWLGPGNRDRLDSKLDRLFGHQLKLAYFPDARQCLELKQGEIVNPTAFVKGYLFYPADGNGEYGPKEKLMPSLNMAPYTLSSHHSWGWWVRFGVTPIPQQGSHSRWMILKKSHWLSPVQYAGDPEMLLDERGVSLFCKSHFRDQSRALLVAELNDVSGVWQELARGFVLAP